MSKINFSIDTEDLYEEGFESIVVDQITHKLARKFEEKADSLVTEKVDKMIAASVECAVDKKLKALMDEPVVISDRWGNKKFLGTAEDYMKPEIDSKLLKPVDSGGRALSGCTTTEQTWIEWAVAKKLNETVENIVKNTQQQSERHFTMVAKDALKKGIDEAASNAVRNTIATLIEKK